MNKLLLALALMTALFTNIAFAEKISFIGGEYEGELRDGKPHGEGILIFSNGHTIAGEWKEGNMVYGTETYMDGTQYIGEFGSSQVRGKGRTGDFVHHGKGTFNYASGGKYVGSFKYGKKHFEGTMTWANGAKYVGNWNQGKKHWDGTMTDSLGNVYVGEFDEDKRHGQGTITFTNGDKYVGEWKNDNYHGMGVLTNNNNGYRYEGLFINGKIDPDYKKKKIKAEKEEKLAKNKAEKEKKMKLQSEAKCANKAGKASNDFAAKKIYESCMAANK
jgi:hypothetical protein